MAGRLAGGNYTGALDVNTGAEAFCGSVEEYVWRGISARGISPRSIARPVAVRVWPSEEPI